MSNPLASLKKSKKPPLFLPEMSKTPTPTPGIQNMHSSRLSPINRGGNDSKEIDLLSSSNLSSQLTTVSSLNSGYSQSLLSNRYWNNTSNPSMNRYSRDCLIYFFGFKPQLNNQFILLKWSTV